jgi:hypothetical protein
MKKMISLLAVALLATSFFTVGCAPWEKCGDATNETACNEPKNFKSGVTCKWEKPGDASSKCIAK